MLERTLILQLGGLGAPSGSRVPDQFLISMEKEELLALSKRPPPRRLLRTTDLCLSLATFARNSGLWVDIGLSGPRLQGRSAPGSGEPWVCGRREASLCRLTYPCPGRKNRVGASGQVRPWLCGGAPGPTAEAGSACLELKVNWWPEISHARRRRQSSVRGQGLLSPSGVFHAAF